MADILEESTYTGQISNVVLKHITLVEDEEFAQEMVRAMKYTSVEHQKPVYEYCAEFRKDHSKYPDWTLLKGRFPQLIQDEVIEFSHDHVNELLISLRRESAERQSSELISQGKHDEAAQVLSNIPTTRKEKRKFTASDTIEEYERMKSLLYLW